VGEAEGQHKYPRCGLRGRLRSLVPDAPLASVVDGCGRVRQGEAQAVNEQLPTEGLQLCRAAHSLYIRCMLRRRYELAGVGEKSGLAGRRTTDKEEKLETTQGAAGAAGDRQARRFEQAPWVLPSRMDRPAKMDWLRTTVRRRRRRRRHRFLLDLLDHTSPFQLPTLLHGRTELGLRSRQHLLLLRAPPPPA
jgi:hypothetical protein